MPPKAANPKAQWCEEEVKALVKFLYDHRSEAGDNGNFKSSTYHATAGHIAPLLKDGPLKTSTAVKNKWTGYIQKIYQDIEQYRAVRLGAHWDNKRGANIQGKDSEQVFEDFTKDHPLMRQFKTSGWEFYPLVEQIIPNGAARRIHAFSPGGSRVGGSSLAV
ncbi:hypothetical protein PISMIDRAFT_94211 [Pisolithus microcarpus 441]|uniref:Myb/SANT-like domain-containing protein n=1 Tax=Pisolithus microcarpus 441 TaxID=765257 RepID=A0A0C9ZLW1_9AGAM|nr:hypothetical protein PISMIDRAFT_94211 [Pisolithus microcarpus 441]